MENLLVIKYKGSEFKFNPDGIYFDTSVEGDSTVISFFNGDGFTLAIKCCPKKAARLEAAFYKAVSDGGISIIDVDEGDC